MYFDERPSAHASLAVARVACVELEAALREAGLPPLTSLTPCLAPGDNPHVEMGGATAATVAAIAQWIRERAR